MNCPKCGTPANIASKFCTNCGYSFEPQQPPVQPQQPKVQQQPMYSAQQPYYSAPQPNYYSPQQLFYPKKKKHIGIWITLLIIIGLVIAIIGIISFSKPKNLGVKYTDDDYNSALAKMGISINFDGMTGSELEQYKDTLNGKKLNINDYTWEFSDYQQKTFTLTPSEATALLNDIAPAFWWFDDLQVNVLEDGTLEGSSKADIARLKTDLFSDIADQIPIPLPNEVNIYSKGNLSISDNVITAAPEVFKVGFVGIPEKYMTEDSVNVMEEYFSRIYTVVPGLQINSLKTDDYGNIVFDGVIPQSVTVKSK